MSDQQFVIHFASDGEDYRWSKIYHGLDEVVSAAARMLICGAGAVMIYCKPLGSTKGKWGVYRGEEAN